MSSARWAGAVVAMAGLVGVAGCGGSGGSKGVAVSSPAVASTPAVAASSTSSPSVAPGTSSSAGSSPGASSAGTAAGAPGVPEPARQHTEAGAEAFAKYYVDLINETGLRPKTGVLEPLSLDSCKTCANYEKNVASLEEDRQRNSGQAAKFHKAVALTGYGDTVIEAVVDQNAIDVVDASGRKVTSYPQQNNVGLVFYLKWTDEGWKSSAIKIDEDALLQ